MNSKSSKITLKTGEDNFVMPEDIKKCGYMKKLKTMKKKYFVLRDNNVPNLANLAYYDSEKKFKNINSQPKRVIYLKDCFSINRKIDGKHKYAIALYTKEDSFATVVDDEQQLKQWLEALIDLQSKTVDFRAAPTTHYEHVWQVNINRSGLGQTKGMNGIHRFCLTSNTLFIFKVDPQNETPDVYEFPLISIRRCGHTVSTFFIELGRSSSLGPGELWIQAGDSAIAQNMHEVILQAMCSSKNNEEFGPSQRPRSASTSDKPISSRRPTQSSHSNQNMVIFGPSYSSTTAPSVLSSSTNKNSIRERCDSMPSRSRTNSESDSTHDSRHWTPVHYHTTHGGIHNRTLSYSPPSHNPLGSTACSTDSAGSSLSIDDYDSSHCLTPVSEHHSSLHNSLIPSEPPISEEDAQTDDYLSMSPTNSSIGNQSSGVRSQLNLSFRPMSASNVSPITSPTFSSSKSMTQPVRDDVSPYMPMSPVGSIGAESISSSRRSSGHEKHLNTETRSSSEYMPMMSSQEIKSTASEEYLNMAPLTQSLSESLANTGAYPLNNLNREEFHLDKVKSYFLPSDESESFDYLPPVRAYSIGSRPQPKPINRFNSKSRQLPKSGTQTPEKESEIRLRAFSMGSHANTREMKVAAKKEQLIEEQMGGPSAPIEEVTKHSKKASSAPVLSPVQQRKRSATVGHCSRPAFNRTLLVDRNDTDLMEIDYSKSMQTKHLKDKIDDRMKRSAAAIRQRSNSRSSTSSSGFGSTSTTSPSITSSMSELTDKKRDISGTHPIHKTSEEQSQNLNPNRHSVRDTTAEVTSGQTTNETKLPLIINRPNISQVSQNFPTVPSTHSTHSSAAVQQSQSQKLPINQLNITKPESIAQKSDENSTKHKFNEDKDGDYVCLDIRKSSACVPQTNTTPIVSQSLLKLNQRDNSSSLGQPIDPNKSSSVPQIDIHSNYMEMKPNSQPIDNLSETRLKLLANNQKLVTNSDAGQTSSSVTTHSLTQILVPNIPDVSPNVSNEKSETTLQITTLTDNCSENASLSSGSGSRPSSVSSNKEELNYASLDLAPTATDLKDEHKLSPSVERDSQWIVAIPPVVLPIAPLSVPITPPLETELLSDLRYAQIDFGIGKRKNAKP